MAGEPNKYDYALITILPLHCVTDDFILLVLVPQTQIATLGIHKSKQGAKELAAKSALNDPDYVSGTIGHNSASLKRTDNVRFS